MEKYVTKIPDVNEIENLHDFYTYTLVKENDKRNLKLTITKANFTKLLKRLNFFKYYINGNNASYIFVQDNKAIPVTEDIIFGEIEQYISSLPVRIVQIKPDSETLMEFEITPQKISDTLINNSSALSNKATFFFLPKIDDNDFHHDSAQTKYFYFNDCIIQLEHGKPVTRLDYSSLTKKVWENNIINRDFTYTGSKGDFEQFFEKITGQDKERKKSLMSMLGYLMHNYFQTNLFAVYLTDVNLDFQERAGGTGKGIIAKALRHVCNRDYDKDKVVVSIKGNGFNEHNERRYADVDVNTQIITIEDLKKTKPDIFITDITEGIDVRKMYADPFRHFVKLFISTNYAPNFDNSSDRRRAKIYELSNYYSHLLTPTDEFRWFFGYEWTSADWNEFYSFMIRCADEYIQNGITEVSEVNFSNRVIYEQTCEDFVYWFEEQITLFTAERKEKMFVKKTLYEAYVKKYPESMQVYKKPMNKFFDWVRLYCRRKNYPYSEFRSTQDEFYIFPSGDTMRKCLSQRKKE
jgi:hypothetical protein